MFKSRNTNCIGEYIAVSILSQSSFKIKDSADTVQLPRAVISYNECYELVGHLSKSYRNYVANL